MGSNEKIKPMTSIEFKIHEMQRQIDIMDTRLRAVLETNESLVKKMEVLQKNMGKA
jgi:hypothetical protein